MTTTFGDRMTRLWNRVDANELRASSLDKAQARDTSRTPPKTLPNLERGEITLPKNAKDILETWQGQECLEDLDVGIQTKTCKEPGCPKMNLHFHTKCYKHHCKIQHPTLIIKDKKDEDKPDNTAPLSKRAREDPPATEERTLRRNGSSSDAGSSTCIPDTDTVASSEAPQTEAVYLGCQPKAKAPPPIPTGTGSRQANGPEDDQWTCRICISIIDKKHFTACLVCHQKQCKMCSDHCIECKKGPICPDCTVPHALKC